MKLNIRKCQCSFTLLTTACIAEGVTSRSLALIFLKFNNKTRLTLCKRNLQSFKSAATKNAKLVYCALLWQRWVEQLGNIICLHVGCGYNKKYQKLIDGTCVLVEPE